MKKQKVKMDPFLMEYIVIAVLVAAATAVAIWYFGRSVQSEFSVAYGAACCVDSVGASCQAAQSATCKINCATEACLGESAVRSASRFNVAPALAPLAPETPGTERYVDFRENEFLEALTNPLSTFSIDVDTGSYTQTRRFRFDERCEPSAAAGEGAEAAR